MILFADAAALIKLYVSEAGSGGIRRAVRNAVAVYSIDSTYVEVCAAFARAGRTGLLRTKQAQAARNDFDRDWQSINVISPDAAMLRRAAELAAAEGLSASAGLSLAAAEAIHRQFGPSVSYRIGTADANAAACAKRLGLPLLDLGPHATQREPSK
jgi:predicted nucleic acid-binding protein